MEDLQLWLTLLMSFYAPSVPIYIVWIVGIVIAATRYRQSPRVSRFAMIGFALLLITSVASTGALLITQISAMHDQIEISALGAINALISLVAIPLNIVAWVLIMLAIFSQRSEPPVL